MQAHGQGLNGPSTALGVRGHWPWRWSDGGGVDDADPAAHVRRGSRRMSGEGVRAARLTSAPAASSSICATMGSLRPQQLRVVAPFSNGPCALLRLFEGLEVTMTTGTIKKVV